MRIGRQTPAPPPPEFTMTFSAFEGWVIVIALNQYADRHPKEQCAEDWRTWASKLDTLLRSRT